MIVRQSLKMGSFEQFVLMIWFIFYINSDVNLVIMSNSTLNALAVTSLIDYCIIMNIQYMKEIFIYN